MPKAAVDRKTTKPPVEFSVKEAKGAFGVLLSRAGFGKERLTITRNGKRIAALVSIEDLDRLLGAA